MTAVQMPSICASAENMHPLSEKLQIPTAVSQSHHKVVTLKAFKHRSLAEV